MSIQEKIRALFLSGKVADETTVPEHIETVMSHVFLFPERVYKIYKGDNEWFNKNFNDLSDRRKRFEFSKNDFHWNQMLCPEVYVGILGAEI